MLRRSIIVIEYDNKQFFKAPSGRHILKVSNSCGGTLVPAGDYVGI